MRNRLRGADAMGQLLYEAVAGGRDVEAEISRIEAAIRRIERERGRGVERPASDGTAGGDDAATVPSSSVAAGSDVSGAPPAPKASLLKAVSPGVISAVGEPAPSSESASPSNDLVLLASKAASVTVGTDVRLSSASATGS